MSEATTIVCVLIVVVVIDFSARYYKIRLLRTQIWLMANTEPSPPAR